MLAFITFVVGIFIGYTLHPVITAMINVLKDRFNAHKDQE